MNWQYVQEILNSIIPGRPYQMSLLLIVVLSLLCVVLIVLTAKKAKSISKLRTNRQKLYKRLINIYLKESVSEKDDEL